MLLLIGSPGLQLLQAIPLPLQNQFSNHIVLTQGLCLPCFCVRGKCFFNRLNIQDRDRRTAMIARRITLQIYWCSAAIAANCLNLRCETGNLNI